MPHRRLDHSRPTLAARDEAVRMIHPAGGDAGMTAARLPEDGEADGAADTVSTAACPAGEQPADFWSRAMCERTGIRYRVHPDASLPFTAHFSASRLDAVSLGDCRGEPARVMCDLWPPARQLAFIFQVAGECLLVLGEHEIFLGPGRFCVSPCAGEMEFRHLSRYRQICLTLDARLAARSLPQWALDKPRAISAGTPPGRLLFDLLQSASDNAHGLSSAQAIDICGVLLNLAGSVLAAAAPNDAGRVAPLNRIKAYHQKVIRDFALAHLCDPELDVAAICRGVNFSPRYVHHLFAQEALHLMEWLWETRLRRAAQELGQQRELSRSIGEIAFAWGFNDRSHFSHAFRRRFGVTPREFRKTACQPPSADAHPATPP